MLPLKKTLFHFFVSALFTLIVVHPICAQNQSLSVVIENIQDDRGVILIALYESADDYMTKRFMSLKVPAVKGVITGVFDHVPEGKYAVSVLHDANNDMTLNKNGMGIPLEGVGFSNNVPIRFSTPDFNKVAFRFPASRQVNIIMKYW